MSIDPKDLDAQRDELLSKFDKSRRSFFKRMGAGGIAAGGAAAGLMPLEALAGGRHGNTPYGGPWDQFFVLDRKSTYMNIGTTGSTPLKVLKKAEGAGYVEPARAAAPLGSEREVADLLLDAVALARDDGLLGAA